MFGAALRVGAAIIPRAARVVPRVARTARRLPVRMMRGAIKGMAKLGANALHKVKSVLPKHIGRSVARLKGKFRPEVMPRARAKVLAGEFAKTGIKSKIMRAAKKIGSAALWFAPIPSTNTIKRAGGMIRKMGTKIKHIVRKPSRGIAKAINRIRKVKVVGGAKKLARRALKVARRHPIAVGGTIGAGLLYRAMAHRRNKQNNRQSDVRDHLDQDKREEGFFESVANTLKAMVKKPVEVAKKPITAAGEAAKEVAKGVGGLLLLLGLAYAFARSRR